MSNKQKINWFKLLIKQDSKLIFGAIFLGLIASGLGLAVALFLQLLIDDILPKGNREALINGVVIVSIILIVKQGLTYTQQYFGILHGKKFNLKLITRFYEDLLRLPKHFFDKNSTGEFIARMNDTSSIQTAIAHIVNIQVLNILTVIVSSIVLFFYSIKIGILLLLSFPVFLVISIVFHKKIIHSQIEVMQANALKETNYITTIQNVDFIKGANKEFNFSKINELLYGNYQHSIFKLGKVDINVRNISEFVGTIFFILLLIISSIMTINLEISIGTFAAIITIASGMLPAIGTLAFSHLQLLGAKVAFDRMYEMITLEKEYDFDKDQEKTKIDSIETISLQHLSFSYSTEKQVLNDVTIQAKRGQITSVFGENGTGKSTILNIIQGLYNQKSGSLLINSIPFKDISVSHLRGMMSYVSQQSKLFDKTIIENICLEADFEKAKEAIPELNKLGFGKYFEKFSNGYETILNEGGANLSGGQRQLLSFARAFYSKPQILLLDEPTAALDRDTENFILKLLEEYKKTGLVILVTHKLKPAKMSDMIYVLKDGIINCKGNHNSLMETSNLYSDSFSELIE